MKKLFFFFIFLFVIQDVRAIALTPPTLEFHDGKEKSFTIINTNDFETKFIIVPEESFKFSQTEFALDKKEMIRISVYSTNKDGREGIIHVKERVGNGRGLQLENGIGLKYRIKREGLYNKITGAAAGLLKSDKVKWPLIFLVLMIAVIFYRNKGITQMIRKTGRIYSKLKRNFL